MTNLLFFTLGICLTWLLFTILHKAALVLALAKIGRLAAMGSFYKWSAGRWKTLAKEADAILMLGESEKS